MVFGGSCLAKIDGKTVFVDECLPGETVEIEILKTKKDYCTAKVVRIIKASNHRVEPFCLHYDSCGGCNFQYASYKFQIELKNQIIIDSLNRNKVSNFPPIQNIVSNNDEYRNRFQFSYGGLKTKHTNAIVVLKDCPCGVKEIRNFLKSQKSDFLQKYDRLQVFASERVLCNDDTQKVVFGIEGQSELRVNLLGEDITFDVRGFFQSNISMLEKTIPLVVKNLEGKNLLDIYSGVGTLSLFASEKFETITLVEHNKKALEFAKVNFLHTKEPLIFAMSGEQWVKKAKKQHYDALIIDPPRSGIEKPLREWICKQKIKTIRYLSCDVSTLARDTKELLNAGYEIDECYFLDFYPNTSHIEMLLNFSYRQIENSGGNKC